MRLYIVGNITKFKDTHYGRPWFDYASGILKVAGHEVCNPMAMDDALGGPEATSRVFPQSWLIGLDLQVIGTCDGIVLPDDWSESRMGRVEVLAALSWGKGIYRVQQVEGMTMLAGIHRANIAQGLLRVFEQEPALLPTLCRVGRELRHQDFKWGPETDHPDGTGGELLKQGVAYAKALCDNAFRDKHGTWRHILQEEVAEALAETEPEALAEELIQVAATCVAWVDAIKRREPLG